MGVLAVKLLLAPSFVVGASVATRRFGARIGGLIGGLPVVAGPILLVYALTHGSRFAAGASAGTLLGLISLIAFVVVYSRLARHVPWALSMVAGWAVFAAATAVFSAISVPAGAALLLACTAIAGGLASLPRRHGLLRLHAPPPAWDLPLRAGCAVALVLALTALAGWLGPRLSGLLAPFPIIATVLAVFTHAQRGPDELVRLLRGLISGFGAFALFCFTLAVSLRDLGTPGAFVLASGVALLTQSLLIVSTRSPQSALRSAAVAPSDR